MQNESTLWAGLDALWTIAESVVVIIIAYHLWGMKQFTAAAILIASIYLKQYTAKK